MAAGGHFWCPKITFDRISSHFRSIRNFCFTKWLPSAILDVRNSLWITFLAILDQYILFLNFLQNGCQYHFGCSKITFDLISGHFRSIRNFNCFLEIFDKMADVGHFLCPKFTFDRISGHFRSICNFNFCFGNFWQNGCRRPFWMSNIHFRSHFWPFEIDRPFWISQIHFWSQFRPFQIKGACN